MATEKESKKYYWLKLNLDFFDREEVKLIENMPNGKEYIIFYMKLLLKSANSEGRLMFREVIPYTDEMLASITGTNIDVVRTAVNMFIQLGMMQKLDNGALFLHEVQNMIGCETEYAKKKREYKDRLKVNVTAAQLPKVYPYKLGKCEVLSYEQIRLPNGTVRFVDEKRYGGNGMIKLAKTDGKCEKCGSEENIVIHHKNGYSNDIEDLEILCKKCHSAEHSRKKSEVCPTDVLPMSDTCPTEIRQEKEIDIEKEKDIDTTTKIDILDKKEPEQTEEKENSSSSSFSLIKNMLEQHGISNNTKLNIMVLVRDENITPERVSEVLKAAQVKHWQEGAIYTALRDKWAINLDAEQQEKQKQRERSAKIDEQNKEFSQAFQAVKDKVNAERQEKEELLDYFNSLSKNLQTEINKIALQRAKEKYPPVVCVSMFKTLVIYEVIREYKAEKES